MGFPFWNLLFCEESWQWTLILEWPMLWRGCKDNYTPNSHSRTTIYIPNNLKFTSHTKSKSTSTSKKTETRKERNCGPLFNCSFPTPFSAFPGFRCPTAPLPHRNPTTLWLVRSILFEIVSRTYDAPPSRSSLSSLYFRYSWVRAFLYYPWF